MDAKELKYVLSQILKNQGKESLTEIELDYLNGKITYDHYLNLCYIDYVNTFYRNRSDQDAIYD